MSNQSHDHQFSTTIETSPKPLNVEFSTFKPVQDAQTLIASSQPANSSASARGGGGLNGDQSDWLGQTNLRNWYYPGFRASSPIPGQTILQSSTVTVFANNAALTDSGLYAKKGSRILLDITANQKWVDHYQNFVSFWGDRSMPTIYGSNYAGQLMIRFGINGPTYAAFPTSTLMVPNDGEIYFYCLDIDHKVDSLIQTVRIAKTN